MRNEENVFVANEKKQLCRSLFHMSQRFSYKKLEKKNHSFLEPITHHCNTNWLSCGEHPIKSLEMKWGFIKRDVSKFCGNYHDVFILNESGSFNDNFIQKP
jgi:hypothetical protein